MDVAIEWLLISRSKIYYAADTDSFMAGLCLWALPTTLFAAISVIITQLVSVDAVGSGIPQMKTVLSGVHLRGMLRHGLTSY